MTVKKYTEEQIIAVLREGEAGARVADLCRKYGMSDATDLFKFVLCLSLFYQPGFYLFE